MSNFRGLSMQDFDRKQAEITAKVTKVRVLPPDFAPLPEPKAKPMGRPRGKRHPFALSEEDEQKLVYQWWCLWAPTKELDPRLLFAIPNGGQRHPVVAAKLKAGGVTPGVPDLFLALPTTYLVAGTCERGLLFAGMFSEMKSRDGQVRPEQREYHNLLKRQGYNVVTAFGADEAIQALTAYCERALEAKP